MQCVNCGFENIPGMERCVRCQGVLNFDEVAVAPPRATRFRWRSRWSRLWNPLRINPAMLWSAIPRWWPATLDLYHIPWESVIWSVVPGLGHIRMGKRLTGWLLLAGWLVMIMLAVLTFGLEWFGWLVAGAVAIHAVAILSFLGTILADQGLFYRFMLGLLLFAALRWLVYGSVGWLSERFYVSVPIGVTMAEGLINEGDVLLCQGPWLHSGGYRRGDLVVHRIPASPYMDGFMVREGTGLDRVVGLPGDHVQITNGQLLVNGQVPPPDELPLKANSGFPKLNGFELRLGSGEYMIFPSWLKMEQPHYVNLQALVTHLSHVTGTNILGNVVYRIHPWSRFGRIGQKQ